MLVIQELIVVEGKCKFDVLILSGRFYLLCHFEVTSLDHNV